MLMLTCFEGHDMVRGEHLKEILFMEKIKPNIRCRKIQALAIGDWKAVDALFKNADFAEYQQGWAEAPSKGFRRAKAAAAWKEGSLIVYAELADDDIFNGTEEKDFNSIAIGTGDVFEIFLKPYGQDPYYEIHVSPNNQKFQLRLPFPGCFQKLKSKFKSSDEMIESFKIWNPVVESRVRIDKDAGKWWVVAEIPFSMMVEKYPVEPGMKWGFSFCRYDYTRPCSTPEYSSTSPHSAINYHLVDEYGILEFIK